MGYRIDGRARAGAAVGAALGGRVSSATTTSISVSWSVPLFMAMSASSRRSRIGLNLCVGVAPGDPHGLLDGEGLLAQPFGDLDAIAHAGVQQGLDLQQQPVLPGNGGHQADRALVVAAELAQGAHGPRALRWHRRVGQVPDHLLAGVGYHGADVLRGDRAS